MFFLYLPQKSGQSPDLLTDVGLATLGPGWSFSDVLANGPDGGHGVFAKLRDEPRGVNLESQEWKAEQGQDPPRYWIGWEKGRKPGPGDLARKKQHPGTLVRLSDGNEWLIPVAQQLPHVNGIKPGGGFKRKLKREYQAFWDQANEQHQQFLSGFIANGGQSWTWNHAEVWPFSCAALAQNYLLTPEIIDALELIEDDNHFDIVNACTEVRESAMALERHAQKKTNQHPAPVS